MSNKCVYNTLRGTVGHAAAPQGVTLRPRHSYGVQAPQRAGLSNLTYWLASVRVCSPICTHDPQFVHVKGSLWLLKVGETHSPDNEGVIWKWGRWRWRRRWRRRKRRKQIGRWVQIGLLNLTSTHDSFFSLTCVQIGRHEYRLAYLTSPPPMTSLHPGQTQLGLYTPCL